jgi:hypothetical protein
MLFQLYTVAHAINPQRKAYIGGGLLQSYLTLAIFFNFAS